MGIHHLLERLMDCFEGLVMKLVPLFYAIILKKEREGSDELYYFLRERFKQGKFY